MRIVIHPKIAEFKRSGFLGKFDFADFAGTQFVDNNIRNGENYLQLVHSNQHIRKVKKACEVKAEMAEMRLAPEYYEVACLGVGTTILASDERNFAVQCLNGHHAGRDFAMGFNLFNSTAIAARRLVNQNKKVCIIDIDGHHGNGTQSIFYRTDKVLCCSIHQRGAFPGTGDENEIGEGVGEGYTLNIPVPAGSGDDVFLGAVERIIKKAQEFNPDIVGIYAGFDGYYADELLDLNYSLDGFRQCGLMIGENFQEILLILAEDIIKMSRGVFSPL